jgi:hypothetical protein
LGNFGGESLSVFGECLIDFVGRLWVTEGWMYFKVVEMNFDEENRFSVCQLAVKLTSMQLIVARAFNESEDNEASVDGSVICQ